ncbi:Nudix hydrolase [Musa troglodytarum]|uniref:Nudix hydrolase n=1 Tax=Musa troglodytarum TaxID=320322 RepID=A0A9E7JA97_9LILI|nr:Nudix hydrolase [Musa troglodytarum]
MGTKGASNIFKSRSLSVLANQSSVLAPQVPAKAEEIPLLAAGIKGVWIKLPIEFANLIEAAVKEGFWFHHAKPNYLMFVCWLPDIKHTIPINASHRVRIGAFVMNDKREIDTEFVEVLAFSQSHMSFFEKSGLSFICMLRPLSHDINTQESEIEAAKWMPMEEYAAQPFVQKHELARYTLDISLATKDDSYAGFSSVGVKSRFFDRVEYLYLNSRVLNHPSITGDASESG